MIPHIVAERGLRFFCGIHLSLSNRLMKAGLNVDVFAEIVESKGKQGVDKIAKNMQSAITETVLQDIIFSYERAVEELGPS